jgi:hypothetical protein
VCGRSGRPAAAARMPITRRRVGEEEVLAISAT